MNITGSRANETYNYDEEMLKDLKKTLLFGLESVFLDHFQSFGLIRDKNY